MYVTPFYISPYYGVSRGTTGPQDTALQQRGLPGEWSDHGASNIYPSLSRSGFRYLTANRCSPQEHAPEVRRIKIKW